MAITIHDRGARNEVSIPEAVRSGQNGTVELDGDDNRVVIGAGTTAQGARIRLGSGCSFECGPNCRLGGIEVEADRGSHVKLGAGSDLTVGVPPDGGSPGAGPSPVRAATAAVEPPRRPAHVATTVVHPADEAMRHHRDYFADTAIAESAYLRHGTWSVDAVRQVADAWFGGLARVPRMLEFGAGFGCVTRHLVREVPPPRLWIADADPDAVRFVQETFGGHGFVVPADPAAIGRAEPFDLIFAPTVFGQVPEPRFEPLLERLVELLAPGGVLAFAVRDELWCSLRPLPGDGFAYVPGTSAGRPGTTFVTEHFVRCCIERICGLDWPYRRLRRGLCGHFDLYVVGTDEAAGAVAGRLRVGPEGCLEHCRPAENGVELSGWAGDPDPGHAPPVVEAWIDGTLIASTVPALPRPDVAGVLQEPSYAAAGWTLGLTATAGENASAVAEVDVRVVADDGRVRPLASASLASLVGRRLC